MKISDQPRLCPAYHNCEPQIMLMHILKISRHVYVHCSINVT